MTMASPHRDCYQLGAKIMVAVELHYRQGLLVTEQLQRIAAIVLVEGDSRMVDHPVGPEVERVHLYGILLIYKGCFAQLVAGIPPCLVAIDDPALLIETVTVRRCWLQAEG